MRVFLIQNNLIKCPKITKENGHKTFSKKKTSRHFLNLKTFKLTNTLATLVKFKKDSFGVVVICVDRINFENYFNFSKLLFLSKLLV